MTLTKKQCTALRRIMSREEQAYKKYEKKPEPGVHPSRDMFAVSDFHMVVLLPGKPEGLPLSFESNSLYDFVRCDFDNREPSLFESVPGASILRRAASEWQKSGSPMNKVALVEMSIMNSIPNIKNAYFNAQYVLDAVEAVGGKPRFYIAYDRTHPQKPPVLFVLPCEWMKQSGQIIAVVCPKIRGRDDIVLSEVW